MIAVSDEICDEVASILKLNRSNITTIHNPISIQSNYVPGPIDKCFGASDKTVISVGRLDDVKNFSLLINAFWAVRSLREGYNDSLIIVGDGGQFEDLMRLVSELELNDAVEFTGFTKDVCKYLLRADFFVSSSRHEGFPLAMLEAVANGLPCVATSTTGSRELSRYIGCVNVVEDHTISALSTAMINAINDTELYVSRDDLSFIQKLHPDKIFQEYKNFVNKKVNFNEGKCCREH